LQATIGFLEDILKLLHPIMPFLTEEVWHLISDREDDIIVAVWPKTSAVNEQLLADFEIAAEVVSGIRNIRKQKNIANKEVLDFAVKSNEKNNKSLDAIIVKLGNLSSISYVDEKLEGAFSFMVKANEYFIPLGDNIDVAAELEKLQKELSYTQGFLKSVEGKLKNEHFVNNAPEQVVAVERKKQADAQSKITVLEEQITALS
jgi:valyl-tRNA synthetase